MATPIWKGIIGKPYSAQTFDAYVCSLTWKTWKPQFCVLHNTGSPTLAQRPFGLLQVHIANLETYYRDTEHWSAGPHLFVDDRQIWVFTPLTTTGVHSPSWNEVSWGVEMLGDYTAEAFNSGRGLAVQKNAIAALATLHSVMGIDSATLRLHHEIP